MKIGTFKYKTTTSDQTKRSPGMKLNLFQQTLNGVERRKKMTNIKIRSSDYLIIFLFRAADKSLRHFAKLWFDITLFHKTIVPNRTLRKEVNDLFVTVSAIENLFLNAEENKNDINV